MHVYTSSYYQGSLSLNILDDVHNYDHYDYGKDFRMRIQIEIFVHMTTC